MAYVRQDSKMPQLKQKLHGFLAHGIQDFPSLVTFGATQEDDQESLQIEESWRKFIDKTKLRELTKKQKEQQDAVWEIIRTEVEFIRDLRIIEDVYLSTLVNLQASIMLNDIETENIFSNISAIEKLHSRFWKEKLSNVPKKARAEKRLPKAVDLVEAFKGWFESISVPYHEFAINQNDCLKYLRCRTKDNEMFRYFVEWAQKHPRSRGLKLHHLLDSPLRRIAKYPVLLAALEKTMDYQNQYLSKPVSEIRASAVQVSLEGRDEMERQKKRGSFEVWRSPRGSREYPKSPSDELFSESFDCVSVEEAKTLELEETLNDIMRHGLQDFSSLLTFSTTREDDEGCFKIKESWRAYADKEKLSELDEKETDLQDAIWEIIKSEVGFIRDIRIVVDFYLCTLLNVQASVFLNEVETELIFGNITAIEKLHTTFWKEKLSNVVKKAQAEKELPSVSNLAEAFQEFASLFAPYLEFCTSQKNCLKYLKDQSRQNNMFKFFIEWAERHPNSRGLKLMDLLEYPMQHIAKYPLLLTEVESKLCESQTEVSSTISQVKEFVKKVMHESTQRQEEQGDEDGGEQIDSTENKTSTIGTLTKQDDSSCEYVDEIVTCLVRQDPRLKELQQMLDDILTNGVQDVMSLLTFGTKEEDAECFQIENSWRDFADEETLSGLDERQTGQQEAIWELILTESRFVQRIGIIEDVYLNTLLNLQASIMLNEIETEKVFGSIAVIKKLHTRFWKEKLSKVAEKARAEKRLPSASDLSEAFEGFGNLFAPYIEFSEQYHECQKYLRQQIKTNEKFRYFLKWAKGHPKSQGESLEDLLQCPLGRIAKYPDFLTAVERKTLEDGTLSQRIQEVKEFVSRVDHELKQEEDRMKTNCNHRTSMKDKEADSSCEYVDEVVTALIRQDSKMVQLQEVLDDLMASGLQDFKGLLQFCPPTEDKESCLQVQDTWQELVGPEELCKMDKQEVEQQDAIWEIVKTESCFIQDIRVVDLYLRTLLNVQAAMLLSDIQTEKMFGNISAIENVHDKFWKKLSSITSMVRAGQGMPSVVDLAEAFEEFPQLFAPYIKYGVAQSKCLKYLREQKVNNEMFRMILEWVERHPDGRGLKLQDLLSLPMQRIARYPILLAAIEGTLDEQDKSEVSEMMSQVKTFVRHVYLVSKQAKERRILPEGTGSQSPLIRKAAVRHQSSSKEDNKMLLLMEMLEEFVTDGIPDSPAVLSLSGKREDDEKSFQIEESWRSLGDQERLSEMNKKEEDEQDAIWKIITTEVQFIQDLHLILNLHQRSLTNLQASHILNEIENEKIFRITDAILRLHTRFWNDSLSTVISKAREEKRFLSARDLVDAFEGFADHFAPYTVFSKAQKECIKYLREQIIHNKMFRYYLEWTEKHPTTRGRCLQDFLVCPMQHITKYSLLLSRLEETVDDQDKMEVSKTLAEVRKFLMLVSPKNGQKAESQGPVEQLGATSQHKGAVGGHGTNPSGEYVEVFEDLASEDSDMLRLTQTLDEFATYGLQDFPALLTFTMKRKDEEWFDIERSWIEFIDQERVCELDQSSVDQQDAIWEIISTEVSFIRNIRIVVDLYLCTLLNLQGAILLNQIQTEKIFSNITAIEKRHSIFWKERLSNVIWKAREEKRLPSALDLAEAFDGLEALFKLHAKFCTTKIKCLKYLQEQTENNKMFRFFIEWVEKNRKSRGLRLQDLLELPGKRIASYPVLLTEVVEKTLKDEDKEALTKRVSEVKQFLMQVPLEMTQESGKDEKTFYRTQSTKDTKMLKLQQTLDEFMTNGLEFFPTLMTFTTDREDDEECLNIEDSWRALTDNNNLSDLDKEQTEQQEAIWEIISAEVNRVKDCRAVVLLYLSTLFNLQANGMLNEIQTEKVFSNTTAIEELHMRFWKGKLSNVLKKARAEKRLPSVADLADAFEGFAKLFAPYIRFCSSSNVCLKYLKQQVDQNPMFTFFLEWAERHPHSRGLKLQDFFVSATQHICRYHCLLKKVEETMSTEDGKMEISKRISEVEYLIGQLNHIIESSSQSVS
ncbi:uncharacterized protein LOC119732129 [Patiria miniata]|uniref:DH domain-containing protein n=1 Tax=Patiria miniata TaxID=46514 RepID=A0A914AC72_PATMI|nr:uncharacterized protein LOC119732129 [Patiria miniata]